MNETGTTLKGKKILVVDDEEDILETIKDILDDVQLDTAKSYEEALEKIEKNSYDLAILDIMGVNGFALLEKTVSNQIPTVMLTAHSINPESLMESIKKGAISYLPKESLVEIDALLAEILRSEEEGNPPWKLLFKKLGDFFDKRFGADWKEKNPTFWAKFDQTYKIGKGIQERLKSDPNIAVKGI